MSSTLTNLSLLSLGRCCRGVEKGEAMRRMGGEEDAQHMLPTLFKDILYSNNVWRFCCHLSLSSLALGPLRVPRRTLLSLSHSTAVCLSHSLSTSPSLSSPLVCFCFYYYCEYFVRRALSLESSTLPKLRVQPCHASPFVVPLPQHVAFKILWYLAFARN